MGILAMLASYWPLPRFMNRGLIEAASTRASRSAIGILPRFMNRGLIEADPHRLFGEVREHFPDS